MQTLTPDKAGDNEPEKAIHKRITSKPKAENHQYRRCDQRLGQARQQYEDTKGSYAAYLTERLKQSLLKAGKVHLLDRKIGIKGNLEYEGKTQRAGGHAEKPDTTLPVFDITIHKVVYHQKEVLLPKKLAVATKEICCKSRRDG